MFNILLQVLDDGRLTDNKGRTVDFKNTILIMTSNVGSDIIQSYMEKLPSGGSADADEERARMLDECRGKVIDVLKASVRPEFLNRIDEIVMFEPLSEENIRQILRMQMEQLSHRLSEDGVTLSFTKAFEDYMTVRGYDPAYGARPVKRMLQRELVNQLATAVLDGSVKKDSDIEVDAVDDKVVIRNRS